MRNSPALRRSLALLCCITPCLAWALEPPVFMDARRLERVQALLPELDQQFNAAADKGHMPGMIYGVLVDGKLVHWHSTGYADLARKTAVTPTTRFRIASMTKSFVAMAAVHLRDRGKLQLDDPVSSYLPELKDLPLPTSDSPVLTVRNLMSMNSGLPQDDPWVDRQMALGDADLARLVAGGLSFSNAPNQYHEYSNLGYLLLGKVVSQAAGMRFQDYITEQILRPLGMRDTHWEFDDAPPAKAALGYHWTHGKWELEPVLHDGAGSAMGGLITTLDDFARYVAFHQDAWPARDGAETGPLRRASVREMAMPRVFSDVSPRGVTTFYGYGLRWRREATGLITVGHAGGIPGYGSQYVFAPDHGVAVIAFTNLRYGPVYGPTAAALNSLIDKAKLPARVLPASGILSKRQAQLEKLIVDWDEDLGRQILAFNFYLDQPRADWMALSRLNFAKLGKLTSVEAIKPLNQLRGKFALVGEHGRLEVSFTLNAEREPKVQYLEMNFIAK